MCASALWLACADVSLLAASSHLRKPGQLAVCFSLASCLSLLKTDKKDVSLFLSSVL